MRCPSTARRLRSWRACSAIPTVPCSPFGMTTAAGPAGPARSSNAFSTPEALRTRRDLSHSCNRSGINDTVLANTIAEVTAEAGATKDVVILRWPEQGDRINDLERLGVPRLLLVEADSPPPPSTSCIE